MARKRQKTAKSRAKTPRRKARARRRASARQKAPARPTAPAPHKRAKAIEAALAGVAHDLRTPLTGMLALAELLAASDLGQREREWAAAIASGAEHLSALTTLIVDAARADAAGLVLRHEPFSPRALVETVAQALTARAANKDVSVKIDIDDLPDMIAGDALRLRAALENLADNAVKFTDAGEVAFSVASEKAARGRVRLACTFSDTGIGIKPAELKQLFRPFAQASAAVAKRYGGAGLGLTFVKRIARAMGGDLTVSSRAGRGSTFRLTALFEPVAAQGGTADTFHAGRTNGLSILCAEDNPYGRVVMNTILRELGHRCDFVDNGEAAVKTVANGKYDAVLMDITLPKLDGLDATRRIRALPGKGQLCIIGISGRTERGDEQAARDAGMNFYFTKPVSPSKLAQALAGLER